jgi:hypothetical protein
MKALIYTWLILGIAFLAYDYLGAPKSQRMVFERGPDGIRSDAAEKGIVEKQGSLGGQLTAPVNTEVARASAPKFEPPAIESLEVLTKNWTVIPLSAFPRAVKLMRDVEFKMSAGSSRMAAGGTVTALGCENGVVTLAPVPTSNARGYARVSETDLKSQFAEPYQKWVAWRVETLRQQWEKNQQTKPNAVVVEVPAGAIDESGKPVRAGNGSYPVLLASMSAGDVTDITPKKVKRMGAPQLVTTEGKPTWVIDVHYDTIVFCGPMEAHAQAHIRDGKVVRWVYPGSGEPVP